MKSSILDIITSNQKKYLDVQKRSAYSKHTMKTSDRVINDFVNYYERSDLKVDKESLNNSIESFIKWKLKTRSRKSYHYSYYRRIIGQVSVFFNYYYKKGHSLKYDRDFLEKEICHYIQITTFKQVRQDIDTRNNLMSFIDYLELVSIKNLKNIDDPLIKKFINYRKNIFYKKRRKYSIDYELVLKSHMSKFFNYLIEDGHSSFKRFFKDPVLPPATPFSDIISKYLGFRRDQENLAKSTIVGTKDVLNKLDQFLQSNHISNINVVKIKHVDSFVNKVYAKKPLSRIHELNSVLRRFFKYLYITGQVGTDVAKYIKAAPIYKLSDVPKTLSDTELKSVMRSIDVNSNAGIRKNAIFSLVLFAGLRVGEVATLTLDDINWEEGTILVRNRKNGHDLLTVLSGHTSEALKKYIMQVRPQEREGRNIFYTLRPPTRPLKSSAITAITGRVLQKLNISGGGHRIRHSFAQNLLESGSSLSEVQMLLGHNNIDSSRIYTKSSLSRMRKFIVDDES
jgi:integrase/recombinase XerD